MQLKFTGFKVAPIRDHIIVEIDSKYRSVFVNEVIEIEPLQGYTLLGTGNWAEVKEQEAKTTAAPAGENRAIAGGKAK